MDDAQPPDCDDPADDDLAVVESYFDHCFCDRALLRQALTHSSSCDANASATVRLAEANERLEFLGDALLGGAMGLLLYQRHPRASEGALSRCKSRLVSRKVLAQAMENAGLLSCCRVATQMSQPWPDSVKANLAEGLLAAIYLDGGWDRLRDAVARLLAPAIAQTACDEPQADVRNRLQEWAFAHFSRLPEYHTERAGGSDHEPVFACTVTIGSHRATAEGGSRRRAESAAATALLRLLDEHGP